MHLGALDRLLLTVPLLGDHLRQRFVLQLEPLALRCFQGSFVQLDLESPIIVLHHAGNLVKLFLDVFLLVDRVGS